MEHIIIRNFEKSNISEHSNIEHLRMSEHFYIWKLSISKIEHFIVVEKKQQFGGL